MHHVSCFLQSFLKEANEVRKLLTPIIRSLIQKSFSIGGFAFA